MENSGWYYRQGSDYTESKIVDFRCTDSSSGSAKICYFSRHVSDLPGSYGELFNQINYGSDKCYGLTNDQINYAYNNGFVVENGADIGDITWYTMVDSDGTPITDNENEATGAGNDEVTIHFFTEGGVFNEKGTSGTNNYGKEFKYNKAGTEYTVISKIEGITNLNSIGYPNDPVFDDKTFEGWFDAPIGGALYGPLTEITAASPVGFYAHWEGEDLSSVSTEEQICIQDTGSFGSIICSVTKAVLDVFNKLVTFITQSMEWRLI
jgi:hypothetical protein